MKDASLEGTDSAVLSYQELFKAQEIKQYQGGCTSQVQIKGMNK
jgi:hypothetical protein